MGFIIGLIGLWLALEVVVFCYRLLAKFATAIIDHRDHARVAARPPVHPHSAVPRLRRDPLTQRVVRVTSED